MSLWTWKRDHYTPPCGCEEADALGQAENKYLGTRVSALERHGIRKAGNEAILTDGENALVFSNNTCALCKFYFKGEQCSPKCPLATKSGKDCFSATSPYRHWVETGDPEPILRALRRAIKKQAAAQA